MGPFVPYDISDYENYPECGILHSFFAAYGVEYTKKCVCSCNNDSNTQQAGTGSPTYYEQDRIIFDFGDYLIFSLDSLFDESGQVKLDALDLEIEKDFEFTLSGITFSFELIAIMNFENSNHFTLAFKNPRFDKCRHKGWSYYDDYKGTFQTYYNFKTEMDILVAENRIPLLVAYRVNEEESNPSSSSTVSFKSIQI